MPSVIDRIASAEEQAQKIRDDAQLKAREIATSANTAQKQALARAKDTAMQKNIARKKSAQAAAERLISEILSARATDTEKICAAAANNLENAIDYICGKAVQA